MLKKHLFTYLMPNIAQAIASFGTVAVLTRLLTEAEYGRFSLVFTIMTLAHYLVLNWSEAAAARFYPEAKEKNEIANHFKTLLTSYIFNISIFIIIAFAVYQFYGHDKATKIALAAAFAGSIVRSLIKISLEARRMDLQAKHFAIVESAYIILGFILTIFGVLFFGFKEQAPFIATLIAGLFVLFIEAPSMVQNSKKGVFEKDRVKSYFHYGYPIAIGLILSTALATGDRFLIAYYLDDASVGAYSAGYQVAARILDIIFAYSASATFPLLIAAYESKDKAAFEQAAKNSFTVRLAIGAPCALGIALVAAPLCDILIGPSLRAEATRIAPWIALAGLLLGLSDYFSDAFIIAKKVFERAVLLLAPALLNIGLNIILLPKIGIDGAIISTIIAYLIGVILLGICGRKYIKLPIPYLDITKIMISCGAMAIIVLLLPKYHGIFELAYKSIIGAITYASMAIFLDFAGARTKLKTIFNRFAARNKL